MCKTIIIGIVTFLMIKQVILENDDIFGNKSQASSADIATLMACGNVVFQLFNHIHLQTAPQDCQRKLSRWLGEIDETILKFNMQAADSTWRSSVGLNDVDDRAPLIEGSRSKWRQDVCDKVANIDDSLIDENQKRQLRFLCRGATPMTPRETEIISNVLTEMQTIYTSKICIPFINKSNIQDTTDVRVMEQAISSYLGAVHTIYSQHLYPFTKENLERDDWKLPFSFLKNELPSEVTNLASKISAEYYTREQKPNEICFTGEPDMERLMTQSKQEVILRWAWLTWREKVGPPMRPFYNKMVSIKNAAAQRNGYSDLGEIWREELEIPNLEHLMDELYNDIQDLYIALHGVARYFLRQFYGPQIVSEWGPIPAHILGNMWAQNWEPILEMIFPHTKRMNLDKIIKSTNWTAYDMLKRAEDFYTSMGLPAMTEKFWKYSYFGDKKNTSNTGESKCHGTAANMFRPNDYRMIYCAGVSMEDFYVIHHEMGHIEYYMAYDETLPVIFKDGANSAFQESIGDSIMYGVLTPQHLQRLGLINDKLMYNNPQINNMKQKQTQDKNNPNNYNSADSEQNQYNDNLNIIESDLNDFIDFDTIILLRQALSKIPQIPYGYIIDKYRWNIFSGKIKSEDYNTAFWEYIKKYQGLEPPNKELRSEKYFDAGAKFHIPDNTPYVRYFLSSFLSVQMFRAMCQWSLFDEASPELTLPMPLHRCDIYGSKKAGHKLKEMMSKGSSLHWSEALYILTGDKNISSSALHQYFAPLKNTLLNIINKYTIPLGW